MLRKTGKTVRLSPESRKAAILKASKKLFAQVGHENFVPLEVAKQCKVSEATIYRYFPSKRDLLVAVAEKWLEEITTSVLPKFTPGSNTYQRLREVIQYGLSVVRSDPALTRYVLLVIRTDPEFRSTQIYRLNRRISSLAIKVVSDAINDGVFRPDVAPRLVRDMIFGAIEHQTWAYQRGEGDFSIEETADGIAGIIFRGLATSAPICKEEAHASLSRLQQSAKVVEQEIAQLGALTGIRLDNSKPDS